MGLFRKSRSVTEKDLNEMRLSERERAIADLERQRIDVVQDIEQVMRLIAKETRRRKLKARKYKLGSSPNDYVI